MHPGGRGTAEGRLVVPFGNTASAGQSTVTPLLSVTS
jgi:hypothetical protein